MKDSDEGPIARWSRRKAAVRESERPEAEPEIPGPAEPSNLVEVEAEPETEPQPLTPIEELDAQSDYTQFLADGVPEAVTRAALRKLWLSDPVLANLDGLNDYDENFNLIDRLITAADTNYKVGKGMLGEDDVEEPPTEDETSAPSMTNAETEADDPDNADTADLESDEDGGKG